MVDIAEFQDSTGKSFFSRWFHTLDGTARARVTESLDRLATGNFSAIQSVGKGVHELRITSVQAIACTAAETAIRWSSF